MSKPDHHLIVGLRVLGHARSQTSLPLLARSPSARRTQSSSKQASIPWPGQPYQGSEKGSLLCLETLVDRPGESTSEWRMLGVCEDQIVMSARQFERRKASFLDDPITRRNNQVALVSGNKLPGPALAPGSLLLLGDPGSGKTRIIRRMLICAAQQNSADKASFYLVAHQPAQFSDIGHLDHCRLVTQTYDRSLGLAVQELVDLVEERRAAQNNEPAVILVVDDLASALQSMDEQAVTLFYWLIHHGPRLRVWTLATLSTRRMADLDLPFLEAFRSRLICHIIDHQQVQALSFSCDLPAWKLEKGSQFYLPYGNGWLRFRLCESNSDRSVRFPARAWSSVE